MKIFIAYQLNLRRDFFNNGIQRKLLRFFFLFINSYCVQGSRPRSSTVKTIVKSTVKVTSTSPIVSSINNLRDPITSTTTTTSTTTENNHVKVSKLIFLFYALYSSLNWNKKYFYALNLKPLIVYQELIKKPFIESFFIYRNYSK